MEKLQVSSKVINARLEQVDTASMAEFNAAAEGRKRVRLVFSALSEDANNTSDNSFLSFCASHSSNALYSIILNFDGMKNQKGLPLSDDEVTAMVWAEAEKANNVLPLTVVNVPVSCALEGVDALYTAQGIRVSVRTLAYIGTADQKAIALTSVASRLQRDITNGVLFKDDPTTAATTQTIVDQRVCKAGCKLERVHALPFLRKNMSCRVPQALNIQLLFIFSSKKSPDESLKIKTKHSQMH